MAEIDALEFGKLLERVNNLTLTMQENNAVVKKANELQREFIEKLDEVSDDVKTLSSRVFLLENSWVFRKRTGKEFLVLLAIVVLFFVYGVKETFGIVAKALLP